MKKIKIKTALVSVSDKEKLEELADYFFKNNIHVISSGGTFEHLKKSNYKLRLTEVSSYTNFQEILNGRVKTLHPLIHAGILADKNKISHKNQLDKLNINPIDLVIVNLYPFENTIKKKSTESDCIENIDIGGPSLIRGAAKNFKSVVVVTSPSQYGALIEEANKNDNYISFDLRKKFATEAFKHTAYYDAVIASWFDKNNKIYQSTKTTIPLKKITNLRYGENPHQKAAIFFLGNDKIQKVSGKDLSYNNINDLEIAFELANNFKKNSCVIVKHGNPCGVALDNNQVNAYKKALKCDPVSAFGGIVAFNKKLDEQTSTEILKIFTEVVIAPDFSLNAKKLLSQKKNLILIRYNKNKLTNKLSIKSTNNFLLIQDKDLKKIDQKKLKFTTDKPNKKVINDMNFAFTVAKFINSNAIVIAKNLSTIGIGVGQTSRIDSAEQAIKRMNDNFGKIQGVLASDGFFPFPDIIKICAKNNILNIIQPGGSLNDDLVIQEAKKQKVNLVFTGTRHFKH